MPDHILQITSKQEGKFLRRKTKPFDFSKRTLPETQGMLAKMKQAMREAKGVGLSANQIGIDAQVFVAEVPGAQGEMKFYSIFNPVIEKASKELESGEEGCLSVTGTYGEVPRSTQLTVRGFDKKGKPIKIKAWGLLARVFQHEIDHLNGILFINRAEKTYEIPTSERLAKKVKEAKS